MLAAGLGGGLAAGIALAMSLQLGAPEPSQPGWLQVVANYQALYVPETLSKGPVLSANAKAEQLASLSNVLDVDLSNLTLVGDLELQRALTTRYPFSLLGWKHCVPLFPVTGQLTFYPDIIPPSP